VARRAARALKDVGSAGAGVRARAARRDAARARAQPTVRPIQRLTAGRIGSDFMTLDSVDSFFAGFAARAAGAVLAAFAAGFALPFAAVPFAVAGAVVFFGFSCAVVFAAFGFAAGFAAAFAAAVFAGALPADFVLDAFFFAPLAAMPFLPFAGV
jgi:hypothetical protein